MAHYDDFVIGFSGSFTLPVTGHHNDLFAELSGDYNPIHFDDSVAKKFGFESRVSNGFVAESRIAAALIETFGSDDTIVVALQKNTRFIKPVYMDDEITAEVTVTGRIEPLQALRIQARCFNQLKVKVIETEMIIKILDNAGEIACAK